MMHKHARMARAHACMHARGARAYEVRAAAAAESTIAIASSSSRYASCIMHDRSRSSSRALAMHWRYSAACSAWPARAGAPAGVMQDRPAAAVLA